MPDWVFGERGLIFRERDASERGQRTVVIVCEPDDILFPGLGIGLRRVLGKAV